jgi:catechol 2,3-dioxygenase-like lactoylglutathione lyase family enzyme
MAVQLDHTIVSARNAEASARFLAEVLGLEAPRRFGPFILVKTSNGVSLDFMTVDGPIESRHLAFRISEPEFDAIFARVRERGLTYWADPHQQQAGEINRRDGGRGVYFEDPDGHLLEILTRPYGSGG